MTKAGDRKVKRAILTLTLVGGITGLTVAVANAGDVAVTQAGKKFSERRLTIAVGDTITFVNDDDTTHNVHSMNDGHAFDLGAQAPGTEMSHTFDTPGQIKVRCAIHPKMKIDVTVE